MARVITALQTAIDQTGTITQQAILWVPVPAEYVPFLVDPGFTSALDGTNLAPTPDELAILRSGAYQEREVTVTVSMQDGAGEPLGLNAVLAALAAALDARYDEESNRIDLANPYVLRGSTRAPDGTWTVTSVEPD